MLKFWWGIDLICGGEALVERISFWKMWVLVMEIDELNFYVAEPQELRQSPNVEKCMGSIVS